MICDIWKGSKLKKIQRFSVIANIFPSLTQFLYLATQFAVFLKYNQPYKTKTYKSY